MEAKRTIGWVAAGVFLVTLFTLAPSFSENSRPDYGRIFTKTDAMIPMRDGVRLHTDIYSPKNAAGPLPILIERTPYGIPEDAQGYTTKLDIYKELIDDGYIFVFQDIRGRYKSEGKFVMNRPPRDPNDSKAVDESTDTYDTIDWLIHHVPNNNGKVGILGISYGGWLTVMAAIDPHPALKAASEQASPADMFLGDDFHHNGAFRLSYGFEYAALMETSKENFHFAFDLFDTFEWYLRLGPLSNANQLYFHGKLPTWDDFVNHPNYDSFWQQQAVWPYLKTVKVPMLNVAGWWDQEDFFGPVKIYETLEKHDTHHWNYLAVGPWNHGGWASGAGRKLGPVDFGSNTSAYFRKNIQAPWFAYWLKGKGKPQAEAVTFETGSNQWQSFNAWPPRQGVRSRSLYFRSYGRLSFQPPPLQGSAADTHAYDSYVSDPRYPVPYRQRPVEPTYPDGGWPTWLLQDQRFVHLRPDVATWETPPLPHAVTVAGDIVAHLYASTTGSDSDWVVKLIDVYPQDYPVAPRMGGYQLMIANEVFRGRFRHSFEKPEAIPPNKIEEYTIDVHTNDHAFLKEHCIMVQVQSTWFPLIDRNPQKFVPNIFKASASDYQEATQRIYRSPKYPSNIELPVLSTENTLSAE